jgi:hypothetical protein
MGAKPGLRRTALLGALAMVAMLSACSFANQNVRPSPEAPSVTSIQPAAPSSTGYQELPTTTSTSAQGKALPWKLIKVDHSDNRIYLSAAQVGCSIPKNVRLVETDSTITLTVIGSDSNGATPCTQQNRTMIGYVTPHSAIGARTVTGNR